MLAEAILVHGEIGVDYSRLRTEIKVHQLTKHQSTGHTPVGHEINGGMTSMVITTQKVPFCAFNSFYFKHFCVVVLHLYSNWHVKDLAMTSNHICG